MAKFGEMGWLEAIRKVLSEAGVSMHYKDITRTIIAKKYRLNWGTTPERSVNSYLSTFAKKGSLFRRVKILGRGYYELVDTSVTTLHSPIVVRPCSAYSCDDSNYKHASDLIQSSDLSQLEKDLLELIVNFRLPLLKDEVCFADIQKDLEKVEFSDKEEIRYQSVDATLLKKKLKELKEQIAEIEREKDHRPGDNSLGILLEDMRLAAEAVKSLLADSGDKVVVSVPLFGEFIPRRDGEDKPKVVIYYKNIKCFCERNKCEEWELMVGVFVHEMFHAWNYVKADQKSRSVLAIDEPMVELEALYFLKELAAFTSSQSHGLHEKVASVMLDRERRVRNKQRSVGDVAAYGFGFYLYEELSESKVDSREWIETYSKKSASISARDSKKVEKALIPIYPFKTEAKVMKWFRGIIF